MESENKNEQATSSGLDDPSCSAEWERDHYKKILERVLKCLKHHHLSRSGIRTLVENAEGAMGLAESVDHSKGDETPA